MATPPSPRVLSYLRGPYLSSQPTREELNLSLDNITRRIILVKYYLALHYNF